MSFFFFSFFFFFFIVFRFFLSFPSSHGVVEAAGVESVVGRQVGAAVGLEGFTVSLYRRLQCIMGGNAAQM